MSTRNPYHDANSMGGYVTNADRDFGFAELRAGERVSPASRPRLGTMLSATITIAVLSTGTWGLYQTHDLWQPWAAAARESAAALRDRFSLAQSDAKAPEEPHMAASTDTPAAPSQPLARRDVSDAPGREAGTPQPAAAPSDAASPAATAAAAPADTEPSSDESSVPPQPLPMIDEPTDPLAKRALALGLHPDLSRSLLTRLSDADYRNAGIAIRTALAAPSEDEVVIWPHQQQPKLARYEIRFVRGAPADCRRYVVTITKDRWATTAHPMEKCGASLLAARSRAASAD